MADDVYPYDAALYDRSFLNCYQRQGAVMLAERVPDLPELFHRCLISTDAVLEHVVRAGVPKYDFPNDLLDPDALGRLGVTREYVPFETFGEARPTVLAAIGDVGYAIAFIDVFYLPHTPEYRRDHVVHTITLVDHDAAADRWSVLDDNRASVLCRYEYSGQIVADAYDNGRLRHVSWFRSGPYDAADAARGSAVAFAELLAGFSDSRRLLREVADLATDPWRTPARVYDLLYDAFALLEGSRTCLGTYLDRHPEHEAARAPVADLVARYRDVRNNLMVGRATGRVDVARLGDRCAELGAAEDALLATLRTAVPLRATS
ncbi:hypothetical protein [Actinomycetospora sp. NBRC 106378]|uniref:hypothetical protein n=1 Tax=Actinomycetospora sp. NBRC 106378 TaxID=3032208 RepID=UPI0024A31A39|nr:hypothetical protein [Actinomycetospora sp. NBRC 106378]GLZ51888.1 hypothetical protein Acsp07_15050 [Actinomycetospora sp. NBRC 106378]